MFALLLDNASFQPRILLPPSCDACANDLLPRVHGSCHLSGYNPLLNQAALQLNTWTLLILYRELWRCLISSVKLVMTQRRSTMRNTMAETCTTRQRKTMRIRMTGDVNRRKSHFLPNHFRLVYLTPWENPLHLLYCKQITRHKQNVTFCHSVWEYQNIFGSQLPCWFPWQLVSRKDNRAESAWESFR